MQRLDSAAHASPELAKVYDPKQVEEKWYARWEERGYFRAEGDPGEAGLSPS